MKTGEQVLGIAQKAEGDRSRELPGPGPDAADAEMQRGLDFIVQCGGSVERTQGGHWVCPSASDFREGTPYLRSRTIYALKRAGALQITWVGRFATARLGSAYSRAESQIGVKFPAKGMSSIKGGSTSSSSRKRT